jgi:hypothetical protein
VRGTVVANAGDRLGLRLGREGSSPNWSIPLVGDRPPIVPAQYRARQEDVHLTLLDQAMVAPIGGGTALTLKVALERPILRLAPQGELYCKRPELAWFSVASDGTTNARPIPISVSNVAGGAGPIWQIQARHWLPALQKAIQSSNQLPTA